MPVAFEIVKAETRLANMVTWYAGIQKRITDFVIGGKSRTKLEAIAVEMEAQDYNTYVGIRKAIPTSIYNTFEFSLLPATKAGGSVRFTASPAPSSDITIPKGTQVSTVATSAVPAVIYETSAATTIAAGNTYVDAAIACTQAGTIGNTGAATITVMKNLISGVTAVSNINPLVNGKDTETEEQRRNRFQEHIRTIARGTNDALVYAAKTARLTDASGNVTEEVVSAQVTGPPSSGSAGAATVYIFNGTTGASANLIAKSQQIIDGYTDSSGKLIPGYKAAGVIVTVLAATVVAQNVVGTVTIAAGYDPTTTKAAVADAVRQYMNALGVDENLVWAAIIEVMMGVPGVINATLTTPAADYNPATGAVVRPGTVTIS